MTTAPLLVDVYAGDFVHPGDDTGHPDIAALVAAGAPWCGMWLKATEGTYYPTTPKRRQWFLTHWQPARELAGDRYGVDWFRGAYHYLRVDQDPIQQADFFLQLIEDGGGWGPGDLWPMVDVEGANNPASASAQQVIDAVSTWASKVTSALGRTPTLYGNIYLWERGVTHHCNCGTLVVARYAQTLPPSVYQRIGWKLQRPPAMPTLFGWQYAGNPEGGALADYPTTCALGAGPADITAVVVEDDPAKALDWIRTNLPS